MKKRRVAVTGASLITPAGLSLEENWTRVIAGKTAIDRIKSFDVSCSPVKLGGEVGDIDYKKYIRIRKFLKFMRRSVRYALISSTFAIEDSRCNLTELEAERVGLFIGGGDIGTLYNEFFKAVERSLDSEGQISHKRFGTYGLKEIDPYLLLHDLANNGLCYISIEHGIKGINNNFYGTEVSGAHAIGAGFKSIQNGEADFVIAGGYSSFLMTFSIYMMYYGMNLLTYENDPNKAMKPYSADRDGFVLGEGTGMVILEDMESARSRGAPIRGEIIGYSCNCDTNLSLLDPDPDGEGLVRAITVCLRDAGISSSEIDYINSEGNATPKNDLAETRAFKRTFGKRAYSIPISTCKPIFGNLGAAASAVEFIITCMGVEKGMIPPTLNCSGGDPECDLDYVPHTPRKKDMEHAMIINKGLGGLNSVLILKKYHPVE